MHAEAGGVDAAALDPGEFKDAEEFELDFGEAFVPELDAKTIPKDRPVDRAENRPRGDGGEWEEGEHVEWMNDQMNQ